MQKLLRNELHANAFVASLTASILADFLHAVVGNKYSVPDSRRNIRKSEDYLPSQLVQQAANDDTFGFNSLGHSNYHGEKCRR